MARAAGIREVARRAGVSTATVSHVINGTRAVRPETRGRVLQAIDDLAYRPDGVARSLTTRRTTTAGVLISNVSNPFFAEVLRGVEDVLSAAGYSYILCNTDGDPDRERRYLDLLLSRRVDGLIVAPAAGPWPPPPSSVLGGVPVVFVDRARPDVGAPSVTVDNAGGALAGAAHLLADGHRRIGVLAGLLAMPSMGARLEGVRRALAARDLPLDPRLVVPSPHTVDAGRAAALGLLGGPPGGRPEALFCANNLLVAGALQAIRSLGLRCPADVGLLAFDDHVWAPLADPPLSVIRQPAEEIGRRAAGLLLRRLGGSPVSPEAVVLPAELVVRRSCAHH